MEIRFDRGKLPSMYHALSPEGKRELLRAALYFHRVTLDGGAAGASQDDCGGFLFVVRKAEKETGIPIIGERITADDVRLAAASYREALEEIAQTFYDIVRRNQDASYRPPRKAFERFFSVDEANRFLKAGKKILVTDFRMLPPSRMAYPSGWTDEMLRMANGGPLTTDAALSAVASGERRKAPSSEGGRGPERQKPASGGEYEMAAPVRIDYLDLYDPYGWTYRLEEERDAEADFLHLPNYREMWERRHIGKELQKIVIAPGTRGTAGNLLRQVGVKAGQPDHYFILYRMKR